jgi:hypothetical protein
MAVRSAAGRQSLAQFEQRRLRRLAAAARCPGQAARGAPQIALPEDLAAGAAIPRRRARPAASAALRFLPLQHRSLRAGH